MHKRIVMLMLLGATAPLARADVVELAPDLYLVIRMSRIEDSAAIKIGAITEASQFAASTGRVATPVTGRLTQVGPILKQYEYQFRLMSRGEALAAKPTLADVVVGVEGASTCGSGAAPTVVAMLPELSRLQPLSERNLLAAGDPKPAEVEPAPDAPAALAAPPTPQESGQ